MATQENDTKQTDLEGVLSTPALFAGIARWRAGISEQTDTHCCLLPQTPFFAPVLGDLKHRRAWERKRGEAACRDEEALDTAHLFPHIQPILPNT